MYNNLDAVIWSYKHTPSVSDPCEPGDMEWKLKETGFMQLRCPDLTVVNGLEINISLYHFTETVLSRISCNYNNHNHYNHYNHNSYYASDNI